MIHCFNTRKPWIQGGGKSIFTVVIHQWRSLCANCAYKNNWRVWRHNASTSHSRDFTDQLWWRHNAMPEKTVLGNNVEMSDQLVFQQSYVFRTYNSMFVLPLVRRYSNDFHSCFVTCENHCQIASLMTKKSLFRQTHTLFYIAIFQSYRLINVTTIFLGADKFNSPFSPLVFCWS